MSIEMQIKCAAFSQLAKHNIKMQYIPVGTGENVSANVKEYFDDYTHEENGVLKNALRGHPLDGCRLKVPKKLQGIVYQEPKCPLDENAKRFFRIKGTFSEFTYWNYDKEPSNNDALKQAFDWNGLANVLHQPITMEEFKRESLDAVTAGSK